jgi:hypothetical protein
MFTDSFARLHHVLLLISAGLPSLTYRVRGSAALRQYILRLQNYIVFCEPLKTLCEFDEFAN